MGSINNSCYIQNHAIMNCAIKRFSCSYIVNKGFTEGMAEFKFHGKNISYMAKKFVLQQCLQPCKYQLSNAQVSDISISVVEDKKLTVHSSHPGAIQI